jgi:hypothetical protein
LRKFISHQELLLWWLSFLGFICASPYFSLLRLLLRKEYCSAADVPSTDMQTQLRWNNVRALKFYLVPSVSGKIGEKKSSLLL